MSRQIPWSRVVVAAGVRERCGDALADRIVAGHASEGFHEVLREVHLDPPKNGARAHAKVIDGKAEHRLTVTLTGSTLMVDPYVGA